LERVQLDNAALINVGWEGTVFATEADDSQRQVAIGLSMDQHRQSALFSYSDRFRSVPQENR
jgi:hypothetical protein